MAEVRVAKSAGFCYGVERAVKLAEETAREKGGCAMLGSIIHNVHVVAELEALGARQVDSVEEVRPCGSSSWWRRPTGRGVSPLSLGSLGIRRSWVWPAGRIAASSFRGRRNLKNGSCRSLPGSLCP